MKEVKAKRTREAYADDCRMFSCFCEKHGKKTLPASIETVVAYLADMFERGRKLSTMQRHRVSISLVHKVAGFEPSPTSAVAVKEAMKGYRRVLGTNVNQKLALRRADVVKIFQTIDDPEHPLAVRDRALLLVGYASGLRRELAALRVEDIEFTDGGMVITHKRAKICVDFGTDLCPVRALRKWLNLAGITHGVVFRHVHWKNGRIFDHGIKGEDVARRVKHYMALIGKDPTQFGAHSMRLGGINAMQYAVSGNTSRLMGL